MRAWRNVVDLHHSPLFLRTHSLVARCDGPMLPNPLFAFAVPRKSGAHSLAPRPGSLVRLAFHKWSAWGDLHSQGCSGLSRTGLLFPVNHTPVGAPGLAPGRLSDLKSLGSAIPSEARRREIGGHEGTCTPKAARF